MMKDFSKDELTLGVVGAGTMGRGIVQLAATADITVLWYDTAANMITEGADFVYAMLDRQVEKEKMTAEQSERSKKCIVRADSIEALAETDVVVEAIVEDPDTKKELFHKLEGTVSEECVIASNTSSIPISSLASDAQVPSRFAGLHFFNPVPLMKVVEVISGLRTRPEVVDNLVLMGERMGHYAPKVVDSPGFLINHAGRGYGTEALRITSERIAAPPDIDRVLREIGDFRMGPFELFDLIGIDVSHAVMESIYDQFYQEPRYKPSPLTRLYKQAKLHGRKTGQGFYTYDEHRKPVPVPEQTFPEGRAVPVWIGIPDAELRASFGQLLKSAGCEIDGNERPGPDSVCLVAPWGEDTSTYAVRNGLPAHRTVAVDTMFGVKDRICLMTSPVTAKELTHYICHAFLNAGKRVTLLNDSCGFVVQRVVANIVNVGCDIAQQGIARPMNIDKAVKIGLGYPMGPLELGDCVGAQNILKILDNMYEFYRDPRYRVSPWLKRRALLGVPLSTEEH